MIWLAKSCWKTGMINWNTPFWLVTLQPGLHHKISFENSPLSDWDYNEKISDMQRYTSSSIWMTQVDCWYYSDNINVNINSHVLQINSLFKRAFKYGYVESVYKLEQFLQDYDDNLFTKATRKTMRCIIDFPVPSLLVITYEVLDMACRSVLSNLSCIKWHL